MKCLTIGDEAILIIEYLPNNLYSALPLFLSSIYLTNIAKGTTDPRVEFISQVQTQILIKFHLQNLELVSTSKSQPNINIYTKVKLQNIDQN